MFDYLLGLQHLSEDLFIFTIVSFVLVLLRRSSQRFFLLVEEKYIAQLLSLLLIFVIKRLKNRMHKSPSIIKHVDVLHQEAHRMKSKLKGDKISLG